MNRQGFCGKEEVKKMWANTSSPHGITLAAASVERPTSPAAALGPDGAAALTRHCVQRPLPPSAGAAPRRGRGGQTDGRRGSRRWRGRGWKSQGI